MFPSKRRASKRLHVAVWSRAILLPFRAPPSPASSSPFPRRIEMEKKTGFSSTSAFQISINARRGRERGRAQLHSEQLQSTSGDDERNLFRKKKNSASLLFPPPPPLHSTRSIPLRHGLRHRRLRCFKEQHFFRQGPNRRRGGLGQGRSRRRGRGRRPALALARRPQASRGGGKGDDGGS